MIRLRYFSKALYFAVVFAAAGVLAGGCRPGSVQRKYVLTGDTVLDGKKSR